MLARTRVGGNDGYAHYAAGADVKRDSEWIRRMLCSGLAEALDGEARAIIRNASTVERYGSASLSQSAIEMGLLPKDIPFLAMGNK